MIDIFFQFFVYGGTRIQTFFSGTLNSQILVVISYKTIRIVHNIVFEIWPRIFLFINYKV